MVILTELNEISRKFKQVEMKLSVLKEGEKADCILLAHSLMIADTIPACLQALSSFSSPERKGKMKVTEFLECSHISKDVVENLKRLIVETGSLLDHALQDKADGKYSVAEIAWVKFTFEIMDFLYRYDLIDQGTVQYFLKDPKVLKRLGCHIAMFVGNSSSGSFQFPAVKLEVIVRYWQFNYLFNILKFLNDTDRQQLEWNILRVKIKVHVPSKTSSMWTSVEKIFESERNFEVLRNLASLVTTTDYYCMQPDIHSVQTNSKPLASYLQDLMKQHSNQDFTIWNSTLDREPDASIVFRVLEFLDSFVGPEGMRKIWLADSNTKLGARPWWKKIRTVLRLMAENAFIKFDLRFNFLKNSVEINDQLLIIQQHLSSLSDDATKAPDLLLKNYYRETTRAIIDRLSHEFIRLRKQPGYAALGAQKLDLGIEYYRLFVRLIERPEDKFDLFWLKTMFNCQEGPRVFSGKLML